MIAEVPTHVAEVKDFFEAPQGYFDRRQFDINIRKSTVRELIADRACDDILDIGCGNGSISIPLLAEHPSRKLTLLDLSEKMLDLAAASLSSEEKARVRIVNDDLMTADLPQKFDLIICLGVLAHVDSPQALIERVKSLLKPGGRLIIEVTDSYHPVGRVLWAYHSLLAMTRPIKYNLNHLRTRDILNSCQDSSLRMVSSYRYSLPPPGSQRIFSHDTLYRATRGIFGSSQENKRAWLGNISIIEFST